MQTTSPYLTAEQLKIQPWERDGLIALVGPLSRSELPGFDMRHWEDEGDHGCGTVRCVGGWVHHYAGEAHSVPHSASLGELYFPSLALELWANISQQQAAHAVLNFLTTGRPRWADAVA